MKTLMIAAALAATMTAAPAFAAELGAAEVQAKLRAAGYTQVHELERDDGMWEAEVTRADGSRDDVLIDPAKGEIFDSANGRAVLDAGRILDLAAKAGYTRITEVDRDGATWSLDAYNKNNQRVDVRMSGYDGRVLSSRRDGWWD
ncbi:PepSY domain-containing protein [Stenotrophomonas oahuensis]|uniref:PepSY domain-containing protein n=1 Tax=Stenotrophomonas oahuensis TaxID=3003271 RepID=A0ABY9YSS8_9GAMM|nr:PepSY domain-containing protein [Stenotrophomonas sp. A5586]WNH53763.1 PepSY domain-containing protein [Stenotrophomonas sp. A5586]